MNDDCLLNLKSALQYQCEFLVVSTDAKLTVSDLDCNFYLIR